MRMQVCEFVCIYAQHCAAVTSATPDLLCVQESVEQYQKLMVSTVRDVI